MWAFLMGLKTVAPDELRSKIGAGGVAVFDVNSRESFREGHVPGARNIDPVSYAPTDLPADKDAPIVFYCSNTMCRKAPNAAKRAKDMGYRNVAVMPAGIKGWRDKGHRTEAD